MPRPEYLHTLLLQFAPADYGEDVYRPFYKRHGLSIEATEIVLSRGHEYLRRTTGVPASYHRIKHNDTMTIGQRTFQVLTGGGHSLEQAMLYRPQERLFLAADQVIARISPNVSVHPMEPALDALGIYLASLRAIKASVNPDVLVLPGHGLPFYGLHERLEELIKHHALRCGEIAAACKNSPLSVAEIVPFLFTRALDAHQTGFAFGEVLAHVNHMLGRERIGSGDGSSRSGPIPDDLAVDPRRSAQSAFTRSISTTLVAPVIGTITPGDFIINLSPSTRTK